MPPQDIHGGDRPSTAAGTVLPRLRDALVATVAAKAWKRHEPWPTTIVDLDTRQVLEMVDGRDSEGVGDWLFAHRFEWRMGVQVVAIDPRAPGASMVTGIVEHICDATA
ncbi:transposase [Arthrobacter sp. W4I7]|uniref:transposase n=1 Tax=Arthrobacter sp. W4I7 TaxID=3042296 RepID=UPI0027830289|nr:transposase [Arthrobacter sp. W4I7]MDQ0689833.1 hypothetical protein [Arthrobacter sp. W4I7]